MQIKKIVFNKGDFKYTIEYFNGKDVTTISTNDQALDSMDVAIKTLISSIKAWLGINDMYLIDLNAVKFGKNEDSSSSVQITAYTGLKSMGIITKVPVVKKTENFPDELQISACLNITALRYEVDRFLKGERAQQELPLEISNEVENE